MGLQAMQKANYMKNLLVKKNIEVLNKDTSIREFLIKTEKEVDIVIDKMAEEGYLAGIKYSKDKLLIAVTEKRTKDEIDRYVNTIKKVLNE